jgi:hypothetical protein
VSVAGLTQLVRAELRAPLIWGLAIGAAQAATPLAFWWLDTAAVYALGLVVIAWPTSVSRSPTDADSFSLSNAGIAGMFVIIAAAAVTGTRWLLVAGLAGHGQGPLAAPASVRCEHTRVASLLPGG